MKLRLVFVGKTRNPHFHRLIEEYLERIRRFLPCEIQEVKESGRKNAHSFAASGTSEDKSLLSILENSPCSVLLDVEGKEMDSSGITAFFTDRIQQGLHRIDFLAAGPWGWSDLVRSQAKYHWSFSRLTLPHELARVVLLEQIFRAQARLNHFPYDK